MYRTALLVVSLCSLHITAAIVAGMTCINVITCLVRLHQLEWWLWNHSKTKVKRGEIALFDTYRLLMGFERKNDGIYRRSQVKWHKGLKPYLNKSYPWFARTALIIYMAGYIYYIYIFYCYVYFLYLYYAQNVWCTFLWNVNSNCVMSDIENVC